MGNCSKNMNLVMKLDRFKKKSEKNSKVKLKIFEIKNRKIFRSKIFEIEIFEIFLLKLLTFSKFRFSDFSKSLEMLIISTENFQNFRSQIFRSENFSKCPDVFRYEFLRIFNEFPRISREFRRFFFAFIQF